MAMNDNYPVWYHGVPCAFYYRQGKYEEAYAQAVQYDLSGVFWTPLLRAACLGQLQRPEEAKEQITHLLDLKPDFTRKARQLIQHFIKEDSLVDHLLEGLKKAGLDM